MRTKTTARLLTHRKREKEKNARRRRFAGFPGVETVITEVIIILPSYPLGRDDLWRRTSIVTRSFTSIWQLRGDRGPVRTRDTPSANANPFPHPSIRSDRHLVSRHLWAAVQRTEPSSIVFERIKDAAKRFPRRSVTGSPQSIFSSYFAPKVSRESRSKFKPYPPGSSFLPYTVFTIFTARSFNENPIISDVHWNYHHTRFHGHPLWFVVVKG